MKKSIFMLFVAAIFIAGCDDEFTEKERIGITPIEDFFTTEDNAEKALIGIYETMENTYIGIWAREGAFLVKQEMGDDMSSGGADASDQVAYQDMHNFRIDPANAAVEGMWANLFKTVNFSNFVIDQMEKSSLSNKNLIIAEAKFLKAWSNFELITMYGRIPLKSEFVTNLSGFVAPLANPADVYTQIENDLTAAIAGLPDKSGVAQPFRAHKGAAQALMGKVLIFQGKTGPAIPFLEAVINNLNHDLEPNVANVWNGSVEYGIESLFEVGAVSTVGYAWGGREADWGGGQNSNLFIQLMGPREGEINTGNSGIVEGWGHNYPSAKLIAAYNAEGNNARKAASILTTAELAAQGGSVAGTPFGYKGAIRVKYAPRAQNSNPNATTQLNYGNNFILMRYSEVLFLAAEAYMGQSRDGEARTQLNKIRLRAGVPTIGTGVTGPALFDTMVNDKFLEHSQEGLRYWDLVRWDRIPAELIARGWQPKHKVLPIPKAEIDKNSAIGEQDQNTGY